MNADQAEPRGLHRDAAVVVFGLLALPWPATSHSPSDARHRVLLALAARHKTHAEMRNMLGDLHAVIRALSDNDHVAAERAARGTGMEVAVDVRPEVRAQLPPPFLQLGMQTHRAFDALADQLGAGASREEVLKSIAMLTGNCVACHATYRLDEVR